jgi:hypothetical protein
MDGGLNDAGLNDAGLNDAGLNDAGLNDAGLNDAGLDDAGLSDAGLSDAGLSDAGLNDAGLDDGGVSDSGLADARLPDAGSSDPALCPIGVADGCCPLLVHGGTDPDCPSLSCTQLSTSADIELVDDTWNEWKGATALAWTGRELVLVRADTVIDQNMQAPRIIFERRSLDGGLLESTTTVPSQRNTTGATSVAFDPRTHSFLFAYASVQYVALTSLDGHGNSQWEGQAHSICNGEDAILQVDAADGKFLVSGNNFTCAGSTGNPVVERWDADGGARLGSWSLGDGTQSGNSWMSSAACDLGCQNLLTQWWRGYEGDLHARWLDPAHGPDAGFTLGLNVSYGGTDATALASDGTVFFSMVPVITSGSGATQIRFQRFDGTQWLGSPVTLAGQRNLAPSAIWTGDGWLIAATTFSLSTSTAFPTSHADYSIQLYHFAPDGTLRESRLFESSAYLPRLAWAGGRIAMTFTRVPPNGGGVETRHLIFFDCP